MNAKKDQKKPSAESVDDLWQRFNAAIAWFETPSFTQQEAADLAGISYSQLRQWNARDQIPFMAVGKRGRPGARQLYSAEDILVIRTVSAIKNLGVPLTSGRVLFFVQKIKSRAHAILQGVAQRDGMKWVIVPLEDDHTGGDFFEWDELPDLLVHDDLGNPRAFAIVLADDLINEVIKTTLGVIKREAGDDAE